VYRSMFFLTRQDCERLILITAPVTCELIRDRQVPPPKTLRPLDVNDAWRTSRGEAKGRRDVYDVSWRERSSIDRSMRQFHSRPLIFSMEKAIAFWKRLIIRAFFFGWRTCDGLSMVVVDH